MLDEITNENEAYEAPPPIFVMTVAPEKAAALGPQRALDARLIGEVLLDRYYRTNVAAGLWKESSLLPEAVVVHQEVVEGELAPLMFYDKRVCYPWEIPEWGLGLLLDRLTMEVEWATRRNAAKSEKTAGSQGTASS